MPPSVPVAALLAAMLLAACAQTPARWTMPPAPPAATPIGAELTLTKSATCECCAGHADYLVAAGMRVTVQVVDDPAEIKDRYGVPGQMRSCHTSIVGDYFVEGHVPLAAIEKLLAERPAIDGIALPGMPAGAAGMGGEMEGPLVVHAIRDGAVAGEFGSFTP
ncbi:MAG TPA: DUF411 domain-containing protein [Candidatus Limnocylindria bacterium]|nr:DUF411 domain-containing protein [Candidatus Limnocylindria bacterium]